MMRRKKTIFIFVATILGIVFIVAAGALIYQEANKEQPSVPVEQVQANIQKADSCNDQNLADLEIIYNNESDASKKALYAEQLGTCYSVKRNFVQAKAWYSLALENYTTSGNTEKVTQMQSAVSNAEFLSKREPQKQAEDATNLDYNVGQN